MIVQYLSCLLASNSFFRIVFYSNFQRNSERRQKTKSEWKSKSILPKWRHRSMRGYSCFQRTHDRITSLLSTCISSFNSCCFSIPIFYCFYPLGWLKNCNLGCCLFLSTNWVKNFNQGQCLEAYTSLQSKLERLYSKRW